MYLLLLVCPWPGWEILAQTAAGERVVESVVPWLAYNSACSSVIDLQNLGDRDVDVVVEAHKATGALAKLAGRIGNTVRLGKGEHGEFKLEIPEETDGAWVRIRERIPAPQLTPVLAVSGATECVDGNRLQTTVRDVAWPLRNPNFSGDVKASDDGVIALINASERAVSVRGCYSSGSLYSVPRGDRAGELTPLCSEIIEELVPPFGTRQFPVSRGGNSHFSVATRGESIVLQMLRPGSGGARVYRVDSSITFGEEAPLR